MQQLVGKQRRPKNSNRDEMAQLDTNCLLRWFLDDIPDQAERVERLILSSSGLEVDDVVVIEAVFALEISMKLSRATIRTFWESAMGYPIGINRELWNKVFPIWVAHPKLSIVDVYLACKAELRSCGPVFSFDQKMIKQLSEVSAVPK